MTVKYLVPIQLPADPTAALQAATKQYVDGRTTTPLGSVMASASGVIDDINTASGGARTIQTVTIGTFAVPVIVSILVALRAGFSGGDSTFGASAVYIVGATSFGDLNALYWARAGAYAGVPITGSYYVAAGVDPSFRLDFNGTNFGGGTCHTGGNYAYSAVRWT